MGTGTMIASGCSSVSERDDVPLAIRSTITTCARSSVRHGRAAAGKPAAAAPAGTNQPEARQ